jgi:hypothetical protein
MGRFRTDEANHIALPCLDHHALGQHDMTPPPSKGTEFDETFIRDQLDNESNLIHVSREHNPGFFYLTILSTYDAAQPVLLNRCNKLKMSPYDLTNLLFIA